MEDIQEYVIELEKEAREKFAKDLVEQFKKNKRLTTTNENGITFALTKEPGPGEGFRITSFDPQMEPVGHEIYKEPKEATQEFITNMPESKRQLRADFPMEDFPLAYDSYHYIYQATRRPLGPGAIPEEGLVEKYPAENPQSGDFGKVIYNYPLSYETLDHFDLKPIGYKKIKNKESENSEGNSFENSKDSNITEEISEFSTSSIQENIDEIKDLFNQYLDKKNKPNITPEVYLSEDDIEIKNQFGRQIITIGPEVLPGIILDKEQLPTTLYHVTTNIEAIMNDNILKSLHEKETSGLGKGTSKAHQGVSLTTNYQTAVLIQTELKRHIEIAKGNIVDYKTTFYQWAREDENLYGLFEGAIQPAVDKTIYWLQFNESIGTEIDPSLLKDGINQYYMEREHDTEIDNPIILGNIKKFADINFDQIDILYVYKENIPDNALIRNPQLNLNEIIIHSEIPIKPALQ